MEEGEELYEGENEQIKLIEDMNRFVDGEAPSIIRPKWQPGHYNEIFNSNNNNG